MHLACGKANLFPFAPAVSNNAPILEAKVNVTEKTFQEIMNPQS